MSVIKIVPVPIGAPVVKLVAGVPNSAVGSQGPAGPKGDTGNTGPQGIQGEQGLKGDTGDQGPQGEPGLNGLEGEQGPQGEVGPQGEPGTPGSVLNYWDGIETLQDPAEDGFLILDGVVSGPGSHLLISSGDRVFIGGSNGEFLNGTSDPENQIATIGDLSNQISTEKVRYSPTFAATGLTFTGTGTTYPTYNSYYVKNGKMVSFVIEVDLSTVTNFGTGQYKLQLPFTPAFGYNHFSGWVWADPDISPDVGTGHTILNADTAGITDVLDLHYLKQSGGANSPIREGLFVQGTPVTLSTISKIYVNGTYICQ